MSNREDELAEMSLWELIDLWWSRREELIAFKGSARRMDFWTLTHEGNRIATFAKVKLGQKDETGPHRADLLRYVKLIEYFVKAETTIIKLTQALAAGGE